MLEIAERELNRISVDARVYFRTLGFGAYAGVVVHGFGPRDTLAVSARIEDSLRERCTQNDPIHPVLKHGPRSLTYVRVLGWQTLVRNESEGANHAEVRTFGGSIDRSLDLSIDLSLSIHVGTRKMVNYA